jgi:hypothetical protein
MKRNTRQDILSEAANLERYAAEALCRADRLRREAEAMKDEPRELVAWWFAWARQVKRAH